MSNAEVVDGKLVLTGPGAFEVSEPIGQTIEVKADKTRSRKLPESVGIVGLDGDDPIKVTLGEVPEDVSEDGEDTPEKVTETDEEAAETPKEEEPEALEPGTLERDAKGLLVLANAGIYYFPDGTTVEVPKRSTRTIEYPGDKITAEEYLPGNFAVEVDGEAPEVPMVNAVYRRQTLKGRVIQRDPGLVFFGDESDFMGIGEPSNTEEAA